MERGFVACEDCRTWSHIPAGFDERRHFARCPKCLGPMFLIRSTTPAEAGMSEAKRVDAGLMLHGEES